MSKWISLQKYIHWDPYVWSLNPNWWWHSVSSLNITIKSVSFVFLSWEWANIVWKLGLLNLLPQTHEIATKDKPAEKSWPSSTITFSNVKPWLLCIVIPYVKVHVNKHSQSEMTTPLYSRSRWRLKWVADSIEPGKIKMNIFQVQKVVKIITSWCKKIKRGR